jgi:hypothetical protein
METARHSKEAGMAQETQMVLGLLADGKISVDDALRLLTALGTPLGPDDAHLLADVAARHQTPEEAAAQWRKAETASNDTSPKARWLRLAIAEDGRRVVNVRLPMALFKVGLAMARLVPEHSFTVNGVSIPYDELVNAVYALSPGQLLEVDDGRNHVEVRVE